MRHLLPMAGLCLLLLLAPAGHLFSEVWEFSADRVSSVQNEEETSTVLEGNARVESEQMDIRADYLKLSGDGFGMISGRGGVSMDDAERGIRIESGRFDYDREAGIIRFRDLVTLVDEDEGIVIRCESLDFLEGEELLILQVSVRLIKDRTVCRGEFATFRREEKVLDISGRPVVWRENDEYRADRIRIDLETDEITMEGTVAGELTAEGDVEEGDSGPNGGAEPSDQPEGE
jgi:lipopolysaccharide export system protein LptA